MAGLVEQIAAAIAARGGAQRDPVSPGVQAIVDRLRAGAARFGSQPPMTYERAQTAAPWQKTANLYGAQAEEEAADADYYLAHGDMGEALASADTAMDHTQTRNAILDRNAPVLGSNRAPVGMGARPVLPIDPIMPMDPMQGATLNRAGQLRGEGMIGWRDEPVGTPAPFPEQRDVYPSAGGMMPSPGLLYDRPIPGGQMDVPSGGGMPPAGAPMGQPMPAMPAEPAAGPSSRGFRVGAPGPAMFRPSVAGAEPSPDLSAYGAADAAMGGAPRMTEGRPLMTFDALQSAEPWQRRLAAIANAADEARNEMQRAIEAGNTQEANRIGSYIQDMERERSLILDRYRPGLRSDPSGLKGGGPNPTEGGVAPLDPAKMQDALRGTYDDAQRFDDARAVDVAQAAGTASDAQADDTPPPTTEQLAEMGEKVGIPREALTGLDLNTTEAKNFGYLLRMMEAESEIRRLEGSNTFGQRLLELIPGQDIESLFMDPDYRRYMLARENFNEAALRAATGATINNSEMPTQRRNYFPLPNDSTENKDFLRRQRQALMMALAAGSGPASKIIPEFGENVVPRSEGPNVQDLSDEELLKMLEGGN